ncbi:hypothetical protein EB001_07895 [bacterium]|nr:hypothetical protein [bacterium]
MESLPEFTEVFEIYKSCYNCSVEHRKVKKQKPSMIEFMRLHNGNIKVIYKNNIITCDCEK